MNILLFLQNKTKADDWTIRLANGLMVALIICGINAVVAMNALHTNKEEEIERRREELLEVMGDPDAEDDNTPTVKGGIAVDAHGNLHAFYYADTLSPQQEELLIAELIAD